jgi:transposase
MAKIVNSYAAGIDISSKEHVVAVPEEAGKVNVRTFQGFTEDLHQLAAWLKERKINTVAMESTGVYWYHLYTILLDQGFEVYLVNAYHVKNVPGRKSDVNDAQWLQQLHSFGLLRSCFQPDNLTRALRNYVRQRKMIIQQMSRQTQRMQKALEQMNIKLNHVIRDLHGKTGTKIITSILDGERDPKCLARHRDPRIRSSKEILLKSLQGNWREEQIFNLRIAYEHYCFLKGQLEKCDQESKKAIEQMSSDSIEPKKVSAPRKNKNQPEFNVSQYLYNALGTDVTKIYGISATTGLTILSETGTNLKEKFPTEKQFLSWSNVVPDNKISGGKIISSKVKKKKNRAGQAFREAANTLWRSETPFGHYLRRKKAQRGAQQAIVATARKIASAYYKLVTEKIEFNPKLLLEETNFNLQKRLNFLRKMTERTELQLTELQIVT